MSILRSTIRHYRLLSTTSSPLITAAVNPNPSSTTLHNDDNIAFINTIKTLTQSRKFNDVKYLIESRRNNSRITDETFVSSLIQSYGVAGMYEQAFSLYNQMEKLGTPMSCISFNAVLSVYNMSIDDHEVNVVHKLFDEMPKKYEFSPDKESYEILIDAVCKLGATRRAVSILEEMEEKGMEISDVMYVRVLDALYKKEKVDKAKELWKEMLEKGREPNVGVYNIRLAYAEKKGKPKDVLALIDEMKKCGLKPDISSYNYLFVSYSKNGMVEEARKVIADLKDNGCLPNGATYRLLVQHLCKTRDFDEAYRVFKESVKMDLVPGNRILKNVVEGLLKSERKKEAMKLIETMRQKHPGDSDSWDKIEIKVGLSKKKVISSKVASKTTVKGARR
ncbi:hypothetical protein ACHQM5_005068 [Ranunculus cassubicifolius]